MSTNFHTFSVELDVLKKLINTLTFVECRDVIAYVRDHLQVTCFKGQEMKVELNLNYTFKVKWLRICLLKLDSMCFFIPYNIFKKVGGLRFCYCVITTLINDLWHCLISIDKLLFCVL